MARIYETYQTQREQDFLDNQTTREAFAFGYERGKLAARMQLLRLVVFGAFGWIFGSEFLWPWVRSLH